MNSILKPNSELRAEARAALRGNWATAVLVTLIYMLVYGAFSYPSYVNTYVRNLVFLPYILIANPILYGYRVYALGLRRGQGSGVGTLFDGFNDYFRVVLTLLLRDVYVCLWSILLIVPGIVKSYSYAMTTFVMKDHPELSYDKAIEASMAMMRGHKMKLFRLDLSFIGWILLGLATAGIGLLWVSPYMTVARAAFYEDIKQG